MNPTGTWPRKERLKTLPPKEYTKGMRAKQKNISAHQLQLLEFLRSKPGPIDIIEIASTLGITRCIIFKRLHTLRERGLAVREGDSHPALWRAIPGTVPQPGGNAKDITGQRFGKFVAIRQDGINSPFNRGAMWICDCDCGNRKRVCGAFLRRGKIKSCGHCRATGRISPDNNLIAFGLDWSWAFVVFRPIPGFPDYRVGSDGTVWSRLVRGGRGRKSNWHLLKTMKCESHKYKAVRLINDDTTSIVSVHRLVLEVFVGPCPDGMEACHFPDRDPGNNNLRNLRWGTRLENASDRVFHKTHGHVYEGTGISL